jgi:hypothetical protein
MKFLALGFFHENIRAYAMSSPNAKHFLRPKIYRISVNSKQN